jgi:beta-carotene 15,15'-dioxygenase
MKNINSILIVLSFVGLWITSMFSGQIEILLGFILIFSFGILHGSNDILIINSVSDSKIRYPFFKIITTYLLIVISAALLFYLMPLVALSFFVIFSGFHFGEQHWEYRNLQLSRGFSQVFFFVYGLLVLQILFILNLDDVILIVNSITSYTVSKVFIMYSLICNILVIFALSIYMFFKSKAFKKIILIEIFYLLIFTIVFKVSTLIWGFTIYFILWHSIPSLIEQVRFIYGELNKKNVINYCKNAFPYWIISLIGIAIVYLVFNDEKMFDALFFSFIAAVTFPHALVMNNMFSTYKKRT